MSIIDTQNLDQLLQASQEELHQIKARIQTIEAYVEELTELHQKAAKLEAFQRGVDALLHPEKYVPLSTREEVPKTKKVKMPYQGVLSAESTGVFLPELAFQEADEVLRHRQSMNYEIFRAVVLNGGKATTAEVRHYLIEQNIRTPQGKSFEKATLSEVYPRIAYLVKRGVLRPIGPGYFLSCFGWDPHA